MPNSVHNNAARDPGYLSRQVVRAERFYLGSGETTAGDLRVTCGGWELVARDYSIQRAAFPWLTLEFVADGEGTVRMAGRTHRLRRGCLFSYGPKVPHRMATFPNRPLSKYFINIEGREAINLLTAAQLQPGAMRTLSQPEEVETLLRMMMSDGRHQHPRTATIVTLQLRILLLKLANRADESSPTASADHRARQTLQRCLDYVDLHYLRLNSVEEVAAACHVSASHLSRMFQRFGRGTPLDYLTRKRMVHAAELLDSGRLLVREAAEQLDMDPFHFSRVFKRIHGLSPAQFLRRHGA